MTSWRRELACTLNIFNSRNRQLHLLVSKLAQPSYGNNTLVKCPLSQCALRTDAIRTIISSMKKMVTPRIPPTFSSSNTRLARLTSSTIRHIKECSEGTNTLITYNYSASHSYDPIRLTPSRSSRRPLKNSSSCPARTFSMVFKNTAPLMSGLSSAPMMVSPQSRPPTGLQGKNYSKQPQISEDKIQIRLADVTLNNYIIF